FAGAHWSSQSGLCSRTPVLVRTQLVFHITSRSWGTLMSLATAKYVSAATESGHGALHDPDWSSWLPISRGLRMVVLGYRVLVAGAILSPPLLWLGIHEGPWSEWLEQHKRHPHALLFLGLIVLALTALFSHGWLLRGYALCLNYAPRHRGAKGFMVASLACVFL